MSLIKVVFLSALALYSLSSESKELLGKWKLKNSHYTLLKSSEKYFMIINIDGEIRESILQKYEGRFPLPSYKVIDGFQKDNDITYNVNIRNRLGLRKKGSYVDAAQPIAAYSGLLAEFTEKHATPEFSSVNEKYDKDIKLEYSEMEKKEIFFELVKLEDNGLSESESKKQISSKYKISIDELLALLQEGIEKDWLSELDRT